MKRILFFLLILFFILPFKCFAAIEMKAQVDKQKISLGEELVYKLVVTATDEPLEKPEFPDFKGFLVLSQAHTSNITVKAKEAKVAAVYVFILLPQETGKLVIAPAQLKSKDKIVKSQSFEIEVEPAQEKILLEPPDILPQTTPEEKITL